MSVYSGVLPYYDCAVARGYLWKEPSKIYHLVLTTFSCRLDLDADKTLQALGLHNIDVGSDWVIT